MENIISVIVATYNQEVTIARTLDSILAQKCTVPVEIVVGEDCSTDGTRAVCERYERLYPSVVRLMPAAPNKGMIRNYYDCMLHCRGKYIAECAGDDFWTDPQKLQKQLDVMEKHPEVTLVHTNWQTYDENTRETETNTFVPFPSPVTCGRDMLETVITQTVAPVVHTCTAMYRSRVMRERYAEEPALYSDPENGCEDIQLVCALASCGDVAYLPDVTLNYSVGHDSVSRQPDGRRQFRFVARTASLSMRLARKYGIRTTNTETFFADKAFGLLMHAFRCRDNDLRREALGLAAEWGVGRGWKLGCVRVLTSCSLLWGIGLAMRKIFVNMKNIDRY